MTDGVEVKLRGLDDLSRQISALKADLRRKVVKGALRDAAAPIRRAAKAAAPVLAQPTKTRVPGVVRDNVRVFASKLRRAARGEIGVYATVAVAPGKRKVLKRVRRLRRAGMAVVVRNDPFYFRFLEMGTKKMRARPFLGPAFQAHRQAALAIFERRIGERIAKANRTA